MSRIASAVLRTEEIVCAAVYDLHFLPSNTTNTVQVVLAINAHSILLLRRNHQAIDDFKPNSIYVTSLSAASTLIALLLLIPLDYTFRHFPLAFVLAVAWFAAFALLIVNFGHGTCKQGAGEFATVALGGSCNEA